MLGNIVEVGGRLWISATLYDRSYGPSVIAQASVAGEAAQLFQLVDDLTAKLLASSYAGPRERLTRTAAITTHSIPALKAYLVGESHLRAGRYGPSVEAFQRAVNEDSTFALAYYRLSLAAEWADRLDLEMDAADRAARYNARLAEQERLLVQALHARRSGAADKAERLYRTVLARYPDDVEAWYQLGEVLFHHNASRGRSLVESRVAWERVLALEPNHRTALVHLARVAAREGKRAELDSLLTRALASLLHWNRSSCGRSGLSPWVPERTRIAQSRNSARRSFHCSRRSPGGSLCTSTTSPAPSVWLASWLTLPPSGDALVRT